MLRKHKYLCTPWINYIQIGTLHKDKIEDLSINWWKNTVISKYPSEITSESEQYTTQRGTGTPHIRQSLFWSITLAAGDVHTHAHTDTHRAACSIPARHKTPVTAHSGANYPHYRKTSASYGNPGRFWPFPSPGSTDVALTPNLAKNGRQTQGTETVIEFLPHSAIY